MFNIVFLQCLTDHCLQSYIIERSILDMERWVPKYC